MLKIIFMDINPYVINCELINNNVWKSIIDSKAFESIIGDELSYIIYKNYNLFENKDNYIEKIGVDKYHRLIDEWNIKFNIELDEFVKTPILDKVFNFFKDAEDENIEIVLISSNPNLKNLNIKWNLPTNVKIEIIPINKEIEAKALIDYSASRNISYDEITIITNSENTISNMEMNKIFCVTINNELKSTSELFVISNIESILFTSIVYNFYNNTDTENNL